MGLKKLLSLLLVMAVMMLPAAGCGGEKEYNAIELVPEGADMIVGIKISEAISKWNLYSAVEEEPEMSEQVEGAMDEFIGQTGVDPRDVLEVVLFANMATLESGEHLGFIMSGDFSDGDLIDKIAEETEMEFTQSKYGGFTMYTDRHEEGAVVVLSRKLIIIGSVPAVKDCIDVAGGKVKRVSGVVMDTYNSLGDTIVRLAMVVPEDVKESFTEETAEAPVPIAMEAFADIQTLGVALDQDMDAMTIKVNADFGSAESAEDAADSLGTMIDFIGMMSPEEETKDLLERIEISASGSRVYINFEVSMSEIEKLGESFMGEMGGMEQMPIPPEVEIPDFDE
jgi:hypothetical protein